MPYTVTNSEADKGVRVTGGGWETGGWALEGVGGAGSEIKGQSN